MASNQSAFEIVVRGFCDWMTRHRSELVALGGMACFGASLYFTDKAARQSARDLDIMEDMDGELTTKQKFEVTYKNYIPAAAFTILTAACIVGEYAVGKKTEGALIGAYAALETAYKQYQNKTKEIVGEEKAEEIDDSIVSDLYEQAYMDAYEDVKTQLIEEANEELGPIPSEGKELFYDEETGNFFESSEAEIFQAKYNLNYYLNTWKGVPLNYWNIQTGQPQTEEGMYLGWVYDKNDFYSFGTSWIDVEMTDKKTSTGKPYKSIKFLSEPTIDYCKTFDVGEEIPERLVRR